MTSIPHFSKIKVTHVNRRTRRRQNTAVIGGGNNGCNQAVRSIQFKKQTGHPASILILLHPDTNFLHSKVQEASKFIPRDRIVSIHLGQLRGNGNGKSFNTCIEGFAIWGQVIDNLVSRIVAMINRHGSFNAEYHLSSGGSAPALVYLMEQLHPYIYSKFVFVGQPTDSRSIANLPELMSKLSTLDDSYRIIYTLNSEIGIAQKEVDYGLVAISDIITGGSLKWDTIDFQHALPKFSTLNVGFTSIPYFRTILFFSEQNHDRTLATCSTLLTRLNFKADVFAFLVGDLKPDIAEMAFGLLNQTMNYELHQKICGVRIGMWNLVGGKLAEYYPNKVATPHFDKLDRLMGKMV